MDAIQHLLVAAVMTLHDAWHPLLGTDWSGPAAVLTFAVALRLVLLPVALWQARQQRAAAALAPQVAAARKHHAGNPRAMAAAVADINRRGGVRTWPQLAVYGVQALLGITVFRLFTAHSNEVTQLAVAGTTLGAHLSPETALVFAAVVAVGAACSLLASLLSLRHTGWHADPRARLMQKAMLFMPLAAAASAVFMPLGALVYVAGQALVSPGQALAVAWAAPVPASALAHPVGRRARTRHAAWQAQQAARRQRLAPAPGSRPQRGR